MEKIKVAIDTNCIIALFRPNEDVHNQMVRIKEIHQKGEIEFYITLKTMDEIEKGVPIYGSGPLNYARSLPVLPNCPVGTWNDLVGTWRSLDGTGGEAANNEKLQERIHHLTKKGVKIRDRQIVIDSYLGGMHVLLTNDQGLCDEGSAGRLREELGILVLSPEKFISKFPEIMSYI